MATPMTGLLMTAEQFLAFEFGEEDGITKWELLEGRVVVSEPRPIHERLRVMLAYEFEAWRRATGDPGRFILNIDTRLDTFNLLAPDAQWHSPGREITDPFERPQNSGEIVVEVLSPSTRRRDLIVKRRVYARNGVQEYWLIDPDLQTVTILGGPEAAAEQFRTETVLGVDDTIVSPLLDGFAVVVGDLFE